MADDDDIHENELRETYKFKGSIDPGIEKILAKLDSEPRSNTIEELDMDYDLDILAETRNIIFGHAKEKLKVDSRARTKNSDRTNERSSNTAKETEIEALLLVGRRVKHKVIEDVIRLMGYVSEQIEFFPYKLTKTGKSVMSIDAEHIKSFAKTSEEVPGDDGHTGGIQNTQRCETTDSNRDHAEPNKELDANTDTHEPTEVNIEHNEPRPESDTHLSGHRLDGETDGEETARTSIQTTAGESAADKTSDNSAETNEPGKVISTSTTTKPVEKVRTDNKQDSASTKTAQVNKTEDEHLCRACAAKIEIDKRKEGGNGSKETKNASTDTNFLTFQRSMSTQTDADQMMFSQTIPPEQVGLESVLIEMDEKTEKLYETIKNVQKDAASERDKVKTLQNALRNNAKHTTERDNMNDCRYADLKANQTSMNTEINRLKEIIAKSGIAEKKDQGNANATRNPKDKQDVGIATIRADEPKQVTYESIWDVNTPNQGHRGHYIGESGTTSSTRQYANETNKSSGSEPSSSLGRYLAQRKATTPSAPTGSNTNREGTNRQQDNQKRMVTSERIVSLRRAPYVSSSDNLLDTSSVQANALQTIVIHDERPYEDEHPKLPDNNNRDAAKGNRTVSWAEEIPDDEMARFFAKQREQEGATTSTNTTKPRTENNGNNTRPDKREQTQPSDINDKTTNKNSSNNSQSVSDGIDNDDEGSAAESGGGSSPNSYAEAAGDQPWSSPRPYKRKWDKRDQKPPLKGVRQQPHREIYIQGISTEGFVSKDEAIAMVKDYCRFAHIIPTQAVVIPVKEDDSQTGCKITVKVDDADRIMADDFWPCGISARPWKARPRGDNNSKNKTNDLKNGPPE